MELKRVVVTGLGAVTRLGNTYEETWENMLKGVSGADTIKSFDTSLFKTHFACEVKDFDPNQFIDRKEARKMDRYTQLAMASAIQAVENSGMDLEKEDKDRIGVIYGVGIGGINTFETAATISTGRLGIFHGMKSYFCQDEDGQIAPVYSISAGLDYPGVGPEHAHLHDIGRAEYVAITDDEAVNAFEYLSKTEGIIPAIESSHALAHAMKMAPKMDKDQIIVVNLSGRGDKDCAAIARYRGEDIRE